jgi:hypothetical protein
MLLHPRRRRASTRRLVVIAGVAGGGLATLVALFALRFDGSQEGPRPFHGDEKPLAGATFPTLSSSSVVIPNDTQGASVDSRAKTLLDGMSLEQLLAFRTERVARFAQLGLFPTPYAPLAGHAQRIYASITPGAKWLGPTAYYVANPYVLVVFTCANHVTPLNLLCPDVAIRYSDRLIQERHVGEAARCWLRVVHEPPYADRPGHVRVIMLNAFDAGFRYAHVDRSRSSNVEPSDDRANILNSAFTQSSFFHVGRYQANNLSPEDPHGWIRLAHSSAPTTIHVKLWHNQPPSTATEADVTYEAVVAP